MIKTKEIQNGSRCHREPCRTSACSGPESASLSSTAAASVVVARPLKRRRSMPTFNTAVKKRLVIFAIICFVIVIMVFPVETKIVPKWRVQVVDVNGSPCSNMRVTQSWGHYSLYTDGNYSSDDRPTDTSGYVQFPERTIRASMPRRIIMPIITRILTIMHGGGGVDGAVWASGIKDVVWLSYKGGKSLPDKMRVEKCIDAAPNNALL